MKTSNDYYQIYYNTPSDINEHLPVLYAAAKKCDHITEFGIRAVVSTWAFLAAKPKKIISYDINMHPNINGAMQIAEHENISFIFNKEDTRKANIEQTDLLFIDTLHTYNQLTIELNKHYSFVNKYIILHDTTTYGEKDEEDSYHLEKINTAEKHGLKVAILEFLENHPEWKTKYTFTNNNGLTVLERTR